VSDIEPTTRSRRRITVIVATAVVLLAVVGGVVYALTRDNGSSSSATAIHASGSTTTSKHGGTAGANANGGSSKTSSPPGASGDGAVPGANSPTTTRSGAGSNSGSQATLPGGRPAPTTKRTLPPDTASPDITAAYTSAFNGECRTIWANAGPDGLFIDADNTEGGAYTIDDCLSQLEPAFAGSWDNVADARQGGIDDADSAVESLTVGNRFITTGGRIYNIP
jgi:hypothetical protein